MLRAVNPADGSTVREVPPHDRAEVERRIARAWATFLEWRERPVSERAAALRAVALALERGVDRFARLMTEEMGKPLAQARAEVDKCAWVARHYADHAAAYLGPEPVATDARRSYVRFDPLGPLLAVMPWNFPFWQVYRAACPALAAGNVVLLKHASNVPGCALAIEASFLEAGLPEGAFATLLVGSAAVDAIIDDPRVCAVTLTGSDDAGAKVGARAGAALKKTVLELGGSDPFVVLEDADLALAAKTAAAARLINSGQSCIAAKRFIVVAAVLEPFLEAFAGHVARARVGDPLDPETEVGPLARADLRDALQRQVDAAVAAGARVVTGGRPLDGPGFFYAPTVLADVTPENVAASEETFGPVAAVLTARDEADALRLANASAFGLGGSVWTRDLARGERFAARLEVGAVFVNGMVKSDPRLPFGGVKRSGYGRELGLYGIREFVNQKTVVVA